MQSFLYISKATKMRIIQLPQDFVQLVMGTINHTTPAARARNDILFIQFPHDFEQLVVGTISCQSSKRHFVQTTCVQVRSDSPAGLTRCLIKHLREDDGDLHLLTSSTAATAFPV